MKPYPEDPRYAESRLAGTIVLYKGAPVEVQRIFRDFERARDYYKEIGKRTPIKRIDNPAYITYVETGKRDIVNLNNLDVNPASLGYLNYRKVASYIVRVPKRGDWRQGFRYNNITSLQGFPSGDIPYSYFVNCVKDNYPSFTECLKKLSKVVSIAWHKDWCIMKDKVVCHRGNEVGKVLEGRVVLDKNKQYLQESLDEVS